MNHIEINIEIHWGSLDIHLFYGCMAFNRRGPNNSHGQWINLNREHIDGLEAVCRGFIDEFEHEDGTQFYLLDG